MRTGLITQKVGMTRIYSDQGEHLPVTVLKLDENRVTFLKKESKEGYNALQIGYGVKTKNVSSPLEGTCKKYNLQPYKKAVEFRISEDNFLNLNDKLNADHFQKGQYVDATGTSLGKGFAGGMKRHNFRGLRASHGVSLTHRSIGSTGNRTKPGRVFKNTKMPGRLGGKRVTIQNLKIIDFCTEKNVIYVLGAVPGYKGSYVYLQDAIKKQLS